MAVSQVGFLDHFGRSLEAQGYIDRFWIVHDIAQDAIRFRVQFRGTGNWREFVVTALELYQGDAGEWARHVGREIAHIARSMALPMRVDALYGFGVLLPEMSITFGEADRKAEATAEKLFKESAPKAFKDLCQWGWTEIYGSNGTHYKLHKKAAYCVERPSDGARLCAVVPGVPLWDHLLGIKLMVEHDETAFLKTANIARA